MKNLITILCLTIVFIPIWEISQAQNTYVPDDNFEFALINLGYDTGAPNDSVPTANIAGVTELNVSGLEIADLTGLESFSSIEELFCNNNDIAAIDISNNAALKILDCSQNELTELDISTNLGLINIKCGINHLSSFNTENNNLLENISCYSNDLTEIDISHNTNLKHFSCSRNQITFLDVSNNQLLETISCYRNPITEIDVSNIVLLETLRCGNMQLTSLDIRNNVLLTTADLRENYISSIDLSNNTALERLYVFNNNLTSLDISNSTLLITLNCENNNLPFGVLEELFNLPFYNNFINNFTYSPQGKVGIEKDTTIEEGTPFVMTIPQYSHGVNDQYQWYKNDMAISGETDLEIDFNSLDIDDSGDYHCIITNSQVTNIILTTKTITLNVSPTTGVDEIDKSSISVYPNPAKTFITIETERDEFQVQLYDLKGNTIRKGPLKSNNTIDVSELPKGMYLLNLSTPSLSVAKKVILE